MSCVMETEKKQAGKLTFSFIYFFTQFLSPYSNDASCYTE